MMMMMMGFARSIAVASLVLAGLAAIPVGAAQLALAPGDRAPHLGGAVYPTGERRDVDWSANRLTLVNFWTTWCKPCKTEMARFEQLARDHAADGFEIIGVHENDLLFREVDNFVRRIGVTYTILDPDRRVFSDWGGIGMWPTSFLVDAQGKILRRYVGAKPEQTDGLAADVEAVLEGRPMPVQVVPAPEEPTPPPPRRSPVVRQGRRDAP